MSSGEKRKIKERESSVWAASNLPPFCLPLAAKEEEEEGPLIFRGGRNSLLVSVNLERGEVQ